MPNDSPIACTLNADELTGRLAEVRALGASSLISSGEDGALRFRGDADTRARLGAIIAAESRCCSFLTFALREDEGDLVLWINAPKEGRSVAQDLADAFAERVCAAQSRSRAEAVAPAASGRGRAPDKSYPAIAATVHGVSLRTTGAPPRSTGIRRG